MLVERELIGVEAAIPKTDEQLAREVKEVGLNEGFGEWWNENYGERVVIPYGLEGFIHDACLEAWAFAWRKANNY